MKTARTYTLAASGIDNNLTRVDMTCPEVLGGDFQHPFERLEEARDRAAYIEKVCADLFPDRQIRVVAE